MSQEPESQPTDLIIPPEARYSNAPTTQLQEYAWQARAVARAVSLPEGLRDKPADVLAVALAGRELGLGFFASLRMVHVIRGQTSIATELKLALAQQAGHVVEALSEGPGWCVVHCATHNEAQPVGWKMRQDTPAGDAYPVDGAGGSGWTIASEIQQGGKPLVDKDVWRSYQRDMLFWRAAGQFMRRHCPGIAGGLYTVEELGEDGDG